MKPYEAGKEKVISHITKSNMNAVEVLKTSRRLFKKVTEELVTAGQES